MTRLRIGHTLFIQKHLFYNLLQKQCEICSQTENKEHILNTRMKHTIPGTLQEALSDQCSEKPLDFLKDINIYDNI